MNDNKLNDTLSASLSILVVDDDELNQRMMKLLLKREGHLVESASNGLEAFNAAKATAYDIILMDLQMPVMDGVDASRHIRAWEAGGRRTFIVALTASFLPEKGRELFEAGIDNYIAKPFDVDHLRNILQFSLEKRKSNEVAAVENTDVNVSPADEDFDHRVGVRRVGGDTDTYKELLIDFIDELPDKMENLWRCYRDGDMDALNRAAHNLKGVSANLGASQLSEYARRLEKQVSEGYTVTVENMLNEISIVLNKFREKASDFIGARE